MPWGKKLKNEELLAGSVSLDYSGGLSIQVLF